MTLPAWPETLPASPLLDGLQETLPDNILRSEAEQGPAKLRRRSTSAVRGLTLAYLLAQEQISALEAFYLDTLAGGAVSFTHTHPRTGNGITCRFKKPPSYSPLNPGYYRAVIELEVLP
jgi:hypothetical protein